MRNVGFFILLFVFGGLFITALFEAVIKFKNHVNTTDLIHKNGTFESNGQNQTGGWEDGGELFTSTIDQQTTETYTFNVQKISTKASTSSLNTNTTLTKTNGGSKSYGKRNTTIVTKLPVTTSKVLTTTSTSTRHRQRTSTRVNKQVRAINNINCTISTLEDVEGIIRSPDEYPLEDSCFTWSINVGEGYSINITVTTLDLDGSSGDYLIISPSEAELGEITNPLFTWHLDNPRQVHIVEQGTAFIMFQTFSKSLTGSQFGGFEIQYSQYGNVTNDTDVTTLPPIPTPSTDVDSDITVYIASVNATNTIIQFYENIIGFRAAISQMAALYCNETGISLTVAPSYLNVVINSVMPCLLTWPNSNGCLQISMAVPVNTTNTSAYELTEPHLQDMWNTYATGSAELSEIGFKVYKVPDNSNLILWIIASVAVIVIFSIVLIVIWRIDMFKEADSDNSLLIEDDLQQKGEDSVYVSVPESFPAEMFDPERSEIPSHKMRSYSAEINRFSVTPNSLPEPPNEPPTIPRYGLPSFGAALHLMKIDKIEEDEDDYEKLQGSSVSSQRTSHEHLYDDPQVHLADAPKRSIFL